MNKNITCLVAIIVVLAFSVASAAEETNPAEESSSLRQVRAAEARPPLQGNGRKRGKRPKSKRKQEMKKRKAKARRKVKKAEGVTGTKKKIGGTRRKIHKKKKTGMKKEENRRNGSKRKGDAKSGRRKKTVRQRQRQDASTSGVMCLGKAVKYMKQWKDVVTNFRKQESRATKHAELGGKKSGKKSEFAPTAYRLVEAGGDNSTVRRARQTATSCAEVITKSQNMTVMITQSPSSSSISDIAMEISGVSSSVECSASEKSSMTTQISLVESARETISEALEAVQEQLATLTGSTVSVTSVVSTSAPSARRDRILKKILQKSI